MRGSHAANNGRIFSRDNPPSTGNPGDEFGCRCWAEKYVAGKSEFAYQELTSFVHDAPHKWDNIDFVKHFYNGGGAAVTLSETGNLQGVIDFYFYTLRKYDDVNAQIIDYARKYKSASFQYPFNNSYKEFIIYLFVFGESTVSGLFTGTVRKEKGLLYIEGKVEYNFKDSFTDPLDSRERRIGTSDPAAATPEILEETEYGGIYYEITGSWNTNFKAEIKADKNVSIYQ